MSSTKHVVSLLERKDEINKRLSLEMKRPLPNDYRVRELKKERLRLQDIIYKLTA
ncbi:DUF465 domain-containing protein [Candidatus Nucleicultrix amoebiphila]|jgi:hypothetical protein|uniref:DUF465 domain-containing protein n=1 Tax=Candidatus Nucleicultrix amoebiphila TaxID=1509244 RepID=UPI0012F4788A|nr:DUF465 domain-containing protein [Candidatus Nucleicultrix amoebiphila]